MSKKAFDKIAAGLTEAVEIAKGTAKPAALYVPAELDVKAIRRKAKMSQEDFAAAFGFTSTQIKDWEQGRSRPLGGMRAYLMLIDSDPVAIQKLLAATRNSQAA